MGALKTGISIQPTEFGIAIKAEKKTEIKEENEEEGTFITTRKYSGFYEEIPLPNEADKANIQSSYNDGVLELKVPKTTRKTRKSKIIK